MRTAVADILLVYTLYLSRSTGQIPPLQASRVHGSDPGSILSVARSAVMVYVTSAFRL